MLGRRGFLKAIGAGVLGMALALKAPKREEGVSERLAREFDASGVAISRMDVLYGWGVARPDYPIRVFVD